MTAKLNSSCGNKRLLHTPRAANSRVPLHSLQVAGVGLFHASFPFLQQQATRLPSFSDDNCRSEEVPAASLKSQAQNAGCCPTHIPLANANHVATPTSPSHIPLANANHMASPTIPLTSY